MAHDGNSDKFKSPREKFLGLSLESSRKSYYPQLLEQLQAEKENTQRLQLLIDNLPARIAFIDNTRRYVLVNREYEEVFGRKKEEIVGTLVRDLVGETNYSRLAAQVDRVLSGAQVHFEALFDSPQRLAKITGAPRLEIPVYGVES